MREADVVRICARASLTRGQSARLREHLLPDVDWARLVDLAERHGVVPLVSHHVRAALGDGLPAAAQAALHGRARTIAARNLMMAAELTRVVRRLEWSGIPALPYKGPLLALAAYGSLALRSFDDLDLLVARRHVREAVRVMGEDGFASVYRLTATQERAYLQTQCEYIVERADVRVELHWEIVPRYFSWRLDPDGLWARAVPTSVAGATVRTLSPEDLLLVLCAHGSKHCWDRMEWVASFAEVLRRHPTLDWSAIRGHVDRAGARRMLDVGLALARDFIEVALPPAASEQVDRDPVARALAREVAHRFLSGELGTLDRAREVSFHVRSRERLRDRVRYAIRLGTTQTLGDWDLVGLPAGTGGLYRLIRPVRLVRKFGAPAIARSLRALAGGSGPGGSRPARPR